MKPDATGPDTKEIPMAEFILRLTVAHHGDNEFHDLGEITHEVPVEQLWAAITAEPPVTTCDDDPMCFIIDKVDPADDTYSDNHEVTRERAQALLGRDLDEAIAHARRFLADVYEVICDAPDRAAELRALADA